MVGDKYTWLAPLARLSPLCLYSGPAVLREVGEVVYSQAENKMNISTIHTIEESRVYYKRGFVLSFAILKLLASQSKYTVAQDQIQIILM